MNPVDGDLFFGVVLNYRGGFGPQPDQFANGAAGAPLGSGLQHFAQFDQRDDDRRGFKIDMLAQYRKNEQGQRIKIGHRRAHGDQNIHVGAFVFKAFEPVYVVIPARIKLNRGGQRPEKPVDPGSVAPHTDETEVPGHTPDKKGQCKNNADDKLAGLIPDLCLPGGLFGIFFFRDFFGGNDAVTGGFNGRDHLLRGGNSRNVFYGGVFTGKVYGSVDDAGYLFVQGAFDVGGTVRAGHAGNRKFYLVRWNRKAGSIDFFNDIFYLQLVGVKRDGGLLGGKINLRFGYAVEFFDRALDVHGAIGAGHARHRQGDFVIGHLT